MKICLSIGADTAEKAKAIWRRWAGVVDMVEIRIDTMDEPDLGYLFTRKPGPVIITNRRSAEGGRFTGDDAQRVGLLLEAVERGTDYIDIEVETSRPLLDGVMSAMRRHNGRIILSWHDVGGTPSEEKLQERFRQMADMDPDIVKIVTFAESYDDNLAVLTLMPYARRQGQQVIAFAMGRYGRPSRVMAGPMGSCITYIAPEEGQEVAPGQLTLNELTTVWRIIA